MAFLVPIQVRLDEWMGTVALFGDPVHSAHFSYQSRPFGFQIQERVGRKCQSE